MTDIEIIKKCAEKMGWKFYGMANKAVCYDVSEHAIIASNDQGGDSVYDPLTDDAQAMAMVKKFGLIIEPDGVMPTTEWWVQVWVSDEIRWTGVANKSLNRAICECVARLS